MFFEFPIEFTEFSRSQEMRPKASEFLSAASALTFQHRPRHTCIEKPSDPSVMLRDISTIIYNLPSFIVNAYRRGTTKPHSLLRFSGPFHAVCLHYSDPFQCVCQTPAWERGKMLLCFAKLWSLDGFYSINGDNDGLRYAQIGGVVFEKLLNVFHFTECIRIYQSILCTISVIPQPLLCLCAVMKSVLQKCVILGVKTECPIYPDYNIATYLRGAAFYYHRLYIIGCVSWQRSYYKVPCFLFLFLSNIVSYQPSRSLDWPLNETKTHDNP